MKDALGAAIRISQQYYPPLAARLHWMRERRRGDVSLRIMEALLRKGDVVCDVGANWGVYAWEMARLVGPTGRVYVFEPDPTMTASLRAIRGGRTSVTIEPIGLSDHEGQAELFVPVHDGKRVTELASLAVPRERSSVEHERRSVRLARLDSIFAEASSPIAFIKVDVEGHELAVLRGADATLRRWRPNLLVEIEQRHQQDGRPMRDSIDHLLGLGYEGYSVHTDGLKPLAQFSLERDQLAFLGPQFKLFGMPREYVHDFLFVREGAPVSGLLASGRA